jgi:hypothetical protein
VGFVRGGTCSAITAGCFDALLMRHLAKKMTEPDFRVRRSDFHRDELSPSQDTHGFHEMLHSLTSQQCCAVSRVVCSQSLQHDSTTMSA